MTAKFVENAKIIEQFKDTKRCQRTSNLQLPIWTFDFETSNLENHEFGHNFFRKPPIKLEIAEIESPDLYEYFDINDFKFARTFSFRPSNFEIH